MYGDYSYNGLSGYQYIDWLDATIYVTEEKALTACSKDPKCSVSGNKNIRISQIAIKCELKIDYSIVSLRSDKTLSSSVLITGNIAGSNEDIRQEVPPEHRQPSET